MAGVEREREKVRRGEEWRGEERRGHLLQFSGWRTEEKRNQFLRLPYTPMECL